MLIEPYNGQYVGSSMLSAVSPEQVTVRQDGSSPFEAPLTSPTISLTSSDSFASNCSDFSVDLNLHDGHNVEAGCSERYMRLNGHLGESANALEDSGYLKKDNGAGKNGYVPGNLGSRTSLNNFDLNDDGSSSSDDFTDEEDEPFPAFDDKEMIWAPPEAENDEDNHDFSMASLAVDDDECADGDGTEWAKPSSLNCFEDGVLCSYRFREEKQKAMEEVMNGKFKNLVCDLLKKLVDNCEQMDESWAGIVTPLAWQAASFVKLDATKGKAMDPAGHVKIKCIASGTRSESRLIKGLVFKKHAAHKHMPTKYKNPRLLLIEGMLDQSSSSSGLSSFNSMITQDKDNNIADLIENLKACHANVILVEKSASRDVLEEVLKMGVTLVLDMKLHRLERVARLTDSPILSSDIKFSQELKHCDSLHFEKFIEEHAIGGEGLKKSCKTLMFLEGCPKRLGCTILLKGSRSEELKKIKCVVQCAVVMAYHFILETSFLVDQKAMFSTIAFGQPDHVSIDEHSTSVVFETSISSHSEKPNVGGASVDGVQIPISSDSDERSSPAQDSNSITTSSGVFEVPISDECHMEDCRVKETSSAAVEAATFHGLPVEVLHNTDVVDGLSSVSYEPHMGPLSTGSSSINDALKKVSIVSPATYRHMSSYIDLNRGEHEAQSIAFTPVSPTEEASDHYDAEVNGSSKGEKTLCNHIQSMSEFATASGDAKKVDDDEECIRPKDEISSVLDSESILVLMSSRNATRGTICEQSHFSHIKFYRNFDVPLGKFLQDNLFNQNLQCNTCGELPEAHFYYYAHHNKQLTIRVKRLGDGEHLPGRAKGKLWMWSRCGKCKPDEEKATKRVLISTAARGLSFGKFLELSFSSHSSFNSLSRCGHSFQKDYLYFFGLGSMVAVFQYSRVTTYTVSVPAEKLEFNSSIDRDWLQKEIESVFAKGSLLFTEVANYLKKIDNRFSGSNLVLSGSSKAFADIVDMLKLEKSEFEDNIKNIGIKDEDSHDSVHKLLSLNRLRWEILLEAYVWDCRLQFLLSPSFLVCYIATDSVVPRQMSLEGSSAEGEAEGSHTATVSRAQGQMIHISVEEVEGTGEVADELVQGQMDKDYSKGTVSSADEVVEGQTGLKDHCAGEVEGMQKEADSGHYDAVIEGKEVSDSSADVEVKIETAIGAHKLSVVDHLCEGMLQRHGEQDSVSSPTTEEDAQRLTTGNSNSCVLLPDSESANSPAVSDNHYSDDNLVSGNQSDERTIPVIADGDDSSCSADIDAPERQASPTLSNEDFKEWVWNPFVVIREECIKDLHKGSLPKFRNLPKFALLLSPDFLPAVSQMISEEESRLHIPVTSGDYIVSDFDGEISSSVACALALMKDLVPPGSDSVDSTTLKRASSEPSSWSLSSSYDPEMIHSTPSMPMPESRFSNFDNLNLLDSSVSYGLHPEVNLGIEKYPIKGKYSVVIAYASGFRGLRNHCCPSELDYIASLSRCKIWDAKGGKSKSFFAKTLDNRLIIKEIKKTEFDSFMKFAPEYFRHMKESFASRNQICLAKILGIYQVTVRHAKSGKETKHDLMVQENLSFGRNITRQYDLKGALHARFTATADGTADVLLDQNFVNDMNSSPLYTGQKSKRLLQRAVWNDTTFLNSVNVMDYSLLVGVDRKQRELVCGIIDYLRQYTWDKQLETWVKSSLVVPKNVLPTIISPREYKKRFRKFMDTHFLTVPDRWCSQRSSNPCKLCGIKGDDSSLATSEKQEE